ncbi:DNA-binding protein [Marinisporobacter balticus]|uniref:Helix-turn-helix protein n=1 Tax=Marinisporobacter balticus TaxID=2018667 RepID=A0A4V2SAL5_9FIRM|nr:DNA-binding protein [Marinisporobacter balticus]TCO72140.1 hypothetical protein EV214_1193 [Marinisporobacter balticus]
MDYISVKDIAKKWHISKRRVQILCSEGRVQGALRIGNLWAIPSDAEKPIDLRTKSKDT